MSIATSYGIINIHFPDVIKEYKPYIENIIETVDINSFSMDISVNIKESIEYLTIYEKLCNNLLFLLISRKHSLGYIDFIRGNYDFDEPDCSVRSLKHLFIQMTDNEIFNIFNYDFHVLWNGLWKRSSKKECFKKEYQMSLEKFVNVKKRYTIDSFKPKYPVNEWGFPKGRKNSNEEDLSCAIRECYEETGLEKYEMNVLVNVNPVTELMVGTNNIKYKHVYYISTVNKLRKLYLNNSMYFTEVDMVGWFTKERIINLIRPYHVKKLTIINNIINFLAYRIYKYKNF